MKKSSQNAIQIRFVNKLRELRKHRCHGGGPWGLDPLRPKIWAYLPLVGNFFATSPLEILSNINSMNFTPSPSTYPPKKFQDFRGEVLST